LDLAPDRLDRLDRSDLPARPSEPAHVTGAAVPASTRCSAALRHPHLTGGGFDLPMVQPAFEEYVDTHRLADRVRFHPGDFFTDPLPSADVLVMGHVLHNWSLDQKVELLDKAYCALPDGGALIVYDSIIDDDRRTNTFGPLMSVAMLLVTHDGFDYTAAGCRLWMASAGFRDSYIAPLVGPESMVVGIK
jgi:O-methyltransferase domain